MKTPHPGELRFRVNIGKTVSTVNANGYPIEADSTVCEVWAGVEDSASKWFYAADAENAQRILKFFIRWRGDVEPGMWVEYRGQRYKITEIGEYDHRRRYLCLNAQAVEGVSP